ncbi:uncharacterized protein LOC125660933 isoform X1 [Ostrea edulis]|uniref:uncharacterized protein LOC125660933 isoform X1 n=1 Tax=Ostrea edulis TaxID=37623 RepID=UPI0024AEC358|nr:uncharacterized protein LOC125660933 isoform X1 [Ostrea edulis]
MINAKSSLCQFQIRVCKSSITGYLQNTACVKMKLCLSVLFLIYFWSADTYTVKVLSNVSKISEGKDLLLSCIVEGLTEELFLDRSNAYSEWIFRGDNRVVILSQVPQKNSFIPKYATNLTRDTLSDSLHFTIVINEVTDRNKGVYTCVVSKDTTVIRKQLEISGEDEADKMSTSLVFVDDKVSREAADRKCELYGFHTPNNRTNITELSLIMHPNETSWTFRDDDRHDVILNRHWLSIRGCFHMNVTFEAQHYTDCDVIYDAEYSLMNAYLAIHNNSCYVLWKSIKEDLMKFRLPESSCGWKCPDVIETGCGGEDAVSLYKVVEVDRKDWVGFQQSYEEDCNALYLSDVELPKQRIPCHINSTCSAICIQESNESKVFSNDTLVIWMDAYHLCAEMNASLPDERQNISYTTDEFPCLGIFKSSKLSFQGKYFSKVYLWIISRSFIT